MMKKIRLNKSKGSNSEAMFPLVLASSSPRRIHLLMQIGIKPNYIYAPSIDETSKFLESGRNLSIRLAYQKAKIVSDLIKNEKVLQNFTILSADTTVSFGRKILPKAETVEDALKCLKMLSGQKHRVFTSICMINSKGSVSQKLVETRVQFMKLSSEAIESYLKSGQWKSKAGGYAIQGYAGVFVTKVVGSYTNVIGLPLYETALLLQKFGYPVHKFWDPI